MVENLKERIYIKGKELFIVGFLLIVLIFIFIIPIACFFLLRFAYQQIFITNKRKLI